MLFMLIGVGRPLMGQDVRASRPEFQVGYSYGPDSSRILIGRAEQRRLFDAGISYFKPLSERSTYRLDYVFSLAPFFRISDPGRAGNRCFRPGGTPFVTGVFPDPQRVIFVLRLPDGDVSGLPCTALYPFYSRQTTDGVQVSPVGMRLLGLPRRLISPYLKVDAGLALSSRDVPVSQGARVNFTFSFGAGLELRLGDHLSTGVEYSYMHISNGNHGVQNPGIDMAVPKAFIGYRR